MRKLNAKNSFLTNLQHLNLVIFGPLHEMIADSAYFKKSTPPTAF